MFYFSYHMIYTPCYITWRTPAPVGNVTWCTSPAKNPINSIHQGITSFSQRQHSPAAGPHRSSPLFGAKFLPTSTAAHRFSKYISQNYIFKFEGLHPKFLGPRPKMVTALAVHELQPLRPLYHPPQGIKNTVETSDLIFSRRFDHFFRCLLQGGTKGLNYGSKVHDLPGLSHYIIAHVHLVHRMSFRKIPAIGADMKLKKYFILQVPFTSNWSQPHLPCMLSARYENSGKNPPMESKV